jgi:hypothetical protein
MDGIIQWSPGIPLSAVEKQVILAAFRWHRGNKSATARDLGISIRTLEARLEEYQGVQNKEKEREDAERQARADNLLKHRGAKTPNYMFTGEEKFVAGLAPTGSERAPAPAALANAQTPSDGSHAGVRVEPAAPAPAQHAVSVPKREEVQKMPQGHSPKGGNNRNR